MRKSSILFFVVLGLAVGPRAATAIGIGFVPAVQTVGLGANVAVDVVVSGLEPDQIVAAFDLDVAYDPLVVTAMSVSFGSGLGALGSEVLTDANLATAGIVDFAAVSLRSDADLAASQGDAVTLATLHFTATALGTSPLTLVSAPPFGIDVKGLADGILTFDPVGDGAIHVVPEPSTLVLVAAGLLGVGGCTRRRVTR
jgi:cohesin domain-containing protein/PEP-CTERM motif-containing protein